MCACLSLCLPLSLSDFTPNTVESCYVYVTIFAYDYLVYCIHYHNIAVRCTKTGIKHGEKQNKTKTEKTEEKQNQQKTKLKTLLLFFKSENKNKQKKTLP